MSVPEDVERRVHVRVRVRSRVCRAAWGHARPHRAREKGSRRRALLLASSSHEGTVTFMSQNDFCPRE